jgi:hypothetical protein
LENDEKLADLITLWGLESKKNKEENATFKLYFRLRVYYPYRDYDPTGVHFYYIQLKYDIHHDRIPILEKDAIDAAAIMLDADYPRLKKTNQALVGKIQARLPISLWPIHDENYWITKVLAAASKTNGITGNEAKIMLYEYMKSNTYSLAEFYNVRVKNSIIHLLHHSCPTETRGQTFGGHGLWILCSDSNLWNWWCVNPISGR